MQTTLEKLSTLAESVTDLAYDLYSDANSRMVHDPYNHPGDSVVFLGYGEFKWCLKESGESVRAELLHLLDNLGRLATAIERDPRAATMLDQIQECRELLAPDRRHFMAGLNVAGDTFARHIDKVTEAATLLADRLAGDVLLVTDTNALIFNPHIESWSFDGVDKFTIVLVPQVLSELETLKSHPNKPEEVRDKAKAIIRQMKEYRNRGKITDGVNIRTGKITLLASAVEPNFEQNLPWLLPTNSDDRILASAVEVLRSHPKCAVGIVTGDFNFQTKIEFAQIDYLEPPPPKETLKPANNKILGQSTKGTN